MSITIEFCNYDYKKKCLSCDWNYQGFCYKYKSWCSFAVKNCDECIITLYAKPKRKINRCKIYKYIPEEIVNGINFRTSDEIYKVKEGGMKLSKALLADEQIDAMVEKYKEGAKVEQLAEWYYVSTGTVRKYLKEKITLRGDRRKTEQVITESIKVDNLSNEIENDVIEVDNPSKEVIVSQKEIERSKKPMNCKSCTRMMEAYDKLKFDYYNSNIRITVELLEELAEDVKSDEITKENMTEFIERIINFMKYNPIGNKQDVLNI